ncbi:AfsR/SARP family transcriptional regulator [Streptomyces tanashiensis]|uniref:Tetratricopeptide repeat protein n=1 Tax=Streptomyces tanashiensis TaxID=67367 RepID=A0ABY6R6V3_9ACTN|nr:BTAD domain-containing putative transcriptional regulator [Streptomyces tanashiensis]UZX25461.1 tetratricopeptide repeat protein [Streptomyces tanashiensis]
MSVEPADRGTGPVEASGPLRIDLLGPVRALRGDVPVALGPVRRQAVLAALVLRAPGFVTYRQLLDDVWGAEPPGTGHRVLPSYVYALRRALDAADHGPDRSVIGGGRGGYRFEPGGARTDLAELAEQAARGRRAKARGDLAGALDAGGRALALLRGEPLPGLPGPLADTERQRLTRLRRALHQERAECLVLLGRHPEALDGLMAAPLALPYDEPLAALRMRALYGSGRQAEALAVYREIRDRLLDELGVEPGEELRGAHQAVLRRDDALLLGLRPGGSVETGASVRPGEAVGGDGAYREAGAGETVDVGGTTHPGGTDGPLRPRRTGDPEGPPLPRRNELPGDTACLVGREAELALLTSPVHPGAVAVTTVDGTAGVGKTALVVRAAWALADEHPDGALFVDLEAHGAADEGAGPHRALRRLLRTVRGGTEELPVDTDDLADLVTAWRAATSGLRLLLVVDGARSAEQVRPLLPAGPGSRVLVAGRQRLPGLDADARLTVEPLAGGDAVALLRALLGEARADREPEAALELARRCGGLPLALRIASARLQNRPSWTLAFLAGRMSDDAHGLGELRAEDRSVEAAFRLSYDRLEPELRRGFRVLGVLPTVRFDGLGLAAVLGRPRAHAEAILEDLVDASLLQEPHPGRYRLHDLVRVHARQLAAAASEEAAADRSALLRLYTAAGRMAGDWGPDSFPTGPGTADAPFADWREASAWLDAAGGELVDVVAYAAAAGEFDHACWIAEALVDHLLRQGHPHECRAALELALACADRATDRRMPSSLRNCMGVVDVHQGRFREAHAWFTEALGHSSVQGDGGGDGGRRDRARAIAGIGVSAWTQGRVEEGTALLEEAVELAVGHGDDWLTGVVTCNLGAIHHQQGRHEQALELYASALALAEKNGRPRTIGSSLCFVAEAQLALGRTAEAVALLRRAADLAREAGDAPLRAAALSRLATAEHVEGRLRAAVDTHHEALSTLTEHTSTWLEMEVRIRLGSTYAAAGRHAEAREEFRTALSLPGAGDHPQQYGRAREGLDGTSAGGRRDSPDG